MPRSSGRGIKNDFVFGKWEHARAPARSQMALIRLGRLSLLGSALGLNLLHGGNAAEPYTVVV